MYFIPEKYFNSCASCFKKKFRYRERLSNTCHGLMHNSFSKRSIHRFVEREIYVKTGFINEEHLTLFEVLYNSCTIWLM